MSFVFYYLTEDSVNPKERNEVEYLRSIGRVVLVTRGGSSNVRHERGVKCLNLPGQSKAVIATYFLWTKICYLICRTSDSLTDRGFPLRNIYTGHPWVRWLVNTMWPIKYISLINRLLPTYEALYFAPFRFVCLFVRDKRRSVRYFQRIVVHDALILRLTRFTPFILSARRRGASTIANVKSWDNPFYSQFVRGANGYLTWSESMWRDVQSVHQVHTSAHHVWGPRPFYNFANAVRLSNRQPNTADGTLVIGYAAAFCDTLMASYEVQVIADIAKDLQARGVDAKILLRPYPIVPLLSYQPLLRHSNVEIVDIQDPPSDRYGDGREMIRFGSDEERIQYLSRCHCFLSIATSFTFEAAIFGLPVLQYFVPKEERQTRHEALFFERLDISDHILKYFLPFLPVVKDTAELARLITAFETDSALGLPPVEMMKVMGFPHACETWDGRSRQLIAEMELA